MPSALIVQDDRSISARLRELFDASLDEMIRIVIEAAGAKADSVDDDPVTAPGTFAYIYGTRAIRRTFRAKGWEIDRTNGVESVFHPERGLKMVFQNADLAAVETQEPRAISEKGNASERAVRLGQRWLFPEMEMIEVSRATANLWYLFVSIEGMDIRAELSRPRSIADGQFAGFHERIFILQRGGLDAIFRDAGDGDAIQVPEVRVSKK